MLYRSWINSTTWYCTQMWLPVNSGRKSKPNELDNLFSRCVMWETMKLQMVYQHQCDNKNSVLSRTTDYWWIGISNYTQAEKLRMLENQDVSGARTSEPWFDGFIGAEREMVWLLKMLPRTLYNVRCRKKCSVFLTCKAYPHYGFRRRDWSIQDERQCRMISKIRATQAVNQFVSLDCRSFPLFKQGAPSDVISPTSCVYTNSKLKFCFNW